MKEQEPRCLIEGRFKAANCPDRIEIFDLHNPQPHEGGKCVPLGIVPVKTPQTQRNACLLALGWLRDNRQITTLDYFQETDKLLVTASSHPQRYTKTPDKDCLDQHVPVRLLAQKSDLCFRHRLLGQTMRASITRQGFVPTELNG